MVKNKYRDTSKFTIIGWSLEWSIVSDRHYLSFFYIYSQLFSPFRSFQQIVKLNNSETYIYDGMIFLKSMSSVFAWAV